MSEQVFEAVEIDDLADYQSLAMPFLIRKESYRLNMQHCLGGITGEIAEMKDAVKQAVFYVKDITSMDFKNLDIVNMGEELGDGIWYAIVSLTLFAEQSDKFQFSPLDFQDGLEVPEITNDADAYRTLVISQRKAAQIEEMFEVDGTVEVGGIYCVVEAMLGLAQYWQLPMLDLLSTNINKLRERYWKKGKYDQLAAIEANRDRASERVTLTQGMTKYA